MRKVFQSTYLGNPDKPEEDVNWDNMQRSILIGKTPFKYIDRLEIGFARVNAANPDKGYLEYRGIDAKKATMTVKQAKDQNKTIEIIAQMDWASHLAPFVADPSKAKARLDAFASSIPKFLTDHQLQGIDFDWESVNTTTMTTDLASYLFTQTRKYLNEDKNLKNPIMTITPDGEQPTGQSLDIDVLNDLFDGVIVQSYERVRFVDNYKDAKIKPSILFCGICSENDPRTGFYPPGGDISKYEAKVADYNLAGLYAWRIDNDDTDPVRKVPKYTITTKMTFWARGLMPNPPLYP